MSLFGSSSTTKQTSSGTSNITGTRATSGTRQNTTADWIKKLAEGFGGEIGGLGGVDANSLVPDANPLQQKGFGDAAGLGGLAETFGGALDMTAAAGQSAAPRTEFVKSAPLMSQFSDPFQKDVIDSWATDFDTDAGRTRAAQDLELAGSGAFGGSGAAITKSMTEGELARARSGGIAGLRSQGFNTALNAAMAEANRKQGANDLNASLYAGQLDRTLNAGRSLADIAATYGGEKRADLGATMAAGDVLRGIQTEKANAVPEWLRRRQELLSGLPLDLFGGEIYDETADTTGTTTTTGTSTTKAKNNSSDLDKIGQAAQIAALFASDRTLKTDVTQIGARPDGLGIYRFKYLWDALTWHVGVMAQEVLKVKPEAVARHPAGFLMVDYSQI